MYRLTKHIGDKTYRLDFKKSRNKIQTFQDKYNVKNPWDWTVNNAPIAIDYVRQAVSGVYVCVHVHVCIPVLVRDHVHVPVRDCDLKTVWCSTFDDVPLQFNKKMLNIISNFLWSADTFCLPIRFVDNTLFHWYVLSPIRFVANMFCSRYVLLAICFGPIRFVPIRFVADTFCPNTFCRWYVLPWYVLSMYPCRYYDINNITQLWGWYR